MENREEYLERFRIDNERMIGETAEKLKSEFGEHGAKLEQLLRDKERIGKLVSGMSEQDYSKLKSVLDNPDVIEKVLSSEKAKKNLMKLLGEL